MAKIQMDEWQLLFEDQLDKTSLCTLNSPRNRQNDRSRCKHVFKSKILWMNYKTFLIVCRASASSICLILHIILSHWLLFIQQLQSILSHLCISQNQFGKIIWTSLFHHMQLLYLKIRIIFSNLPSEVSLCILGFLLIKKSHIVPIRSKPLSTPTDIYKSCVTKVEELSKRLTCLEVSCFFS